MTVRLKRSLEVVDLLELEPVRCVPWQENVDGRVVIDRPRPPVNGIRSLFERANWFMSPRRVRLDEVGSFAWRRLDGSTKDRIDRVGHFNDDDAGLARNALAEQ